jgi:hypothetical protein
MYQISHNRRRPDGTLIKNNEKPLPKTVQEDMFPIVTQKKKPSDGQKPENVRKKETPQKRPYQEDMFHDQIRDKVH